MKKYLFTLCMFLTAISLPSCDTDDDETIFDSIVGRVWIGDLGMIAPADGFPLESAVYFGGDGFGTDDLVYYENGRPYGICNIQWDAYDGNIYINYGNIAPPRELHDVRVRRGTLTGTLYIYGSYYGPVTLRMQ